MLFFERVRRGELSHYYSGLLKLNILDQCLLLLEWFDEGRLCNMLYIELSSLYEADTIFYGHSLYVRQLNCATNLS